MPTIIVTIDAIGKSDGIQNLKITNLCGHLLFDSMDPALLAGVDDDDDDDTFLAGVQGNDTLLAGVPIPATTIMTMMMKMTQMQNPITIPLTPMRPMTIQAKHPYTALEAKHQFTARLMNHHNFLHMRKSWMTCTTHNYLNWKPKFPYYLNLKEFLHCHLTTYPEWEGKPTP